jgi:hypothetical protein
MHGRGRSIFMSGEGGGAGGGGGAGDWRAALPEAVRASPALADVKDVGALAQAFVETKALVGSSIRIPGPDAAPEVRKAFVSRLTEKVPELVMVADGDDDAAKAAREALWQRLGKPKEAKEYALPKDVELPADALEALRAEAADVGLTKAQFVARAKRAAEAIGAGTRQFQEAQAALRKEWGAATDERLQAAAATALKLGDAELAKAIQSGQAVPALAKLLFAVSKTTGETREGAGQGGNGGGGKLAPAEAEARLAEIRANAAFWNPRHPQNASLVRQAEELTALAYPDLKK